MIRLAHFKANVGWAGLIQSGIVGALFLAMCVLYLGDKGSPAPALGFGLGVLIPTLARGWITEDPDRTVPLLRGLGVGLVATSVIGGLLKDQLLALLSEPGLLFGLSFAVMLYLGAYWHFWSDPTIYASGRVGEE